MRILVVEDEISLANSLVRLLTGASYQAEAVHDGDSGLAYAGSGQYDAMILDVMLPGQDGYQVAAALRKAGNDIPILMLTARETVADKVQGLDSGADDYLTKPFGMMELVARVKARLRASAAPQSLEILKCDDLELNSTSHSVTVGGQAVTLTLKEFALLRLFMEHRGVAFTREQLLERNWDYGYEGGTRTVDVHVQTLRTKLGGCGAMIQTVRGVGYKFEG